MPKSSSHTGEEEFLNLRLVGHTDLNGHGDGKQIMVSGNTMYVGHVNGKIGTSIVDVSDPTHPREILRWWMHGMWAAGGETPDWPDDLRPWAHHAIVAGDQAYHSFWDAGFFIMDISDVTNPRPIANQSWTPEDGGNTHTALPLPARKLLITTDEETEPDCKGVTKYARILDIADEQYPRIISKFPIPEGDFCDRWLRFGPHNLTRIAPNRSRAIRSFS